MLQVITAKEELKRRNKEFSKIREGSLFSLRELRDFIAVRKFNEKSWLVIELTFENRAQIIAGQACAHTTLHFSEMHSLNLVDEDYRKELLAAYVKFKKKER